MPTLTINVTAAQLDRVQNALGLSTASEVKQWVIDTIKAEVKNAEVGQVVEAETIKVQSAQDARDSAIQAKANEPEVELS